MAGVRLALVKGVERSVTLVGKVRRMIMRMLRRTHKLADERSVERRFRGFTLIELLVVISVIAVLTSILLPALGRARETSRNVKCLANLKGIGMGLQIYMDTESKGRLLPKVAPLNDGNNTNDPGLLDVMAKYVDASMPVRSDPNNLNSDWIAGDPWRCPSDSKSFDPAKEFKPQWQQFGTSYQYPAGELMLAAELLFVKDGQGGVTKAIEARNNQFPILMDADNWHNPRWEQNNKMGMSSEDKAGWKRNGVFFGDWRADNVPPPDDEYMTNFIADVVKFGGGINP